MRLLEDVLCCLLNGGEFAERFPRGAFTIVIGLCCLLASFTRVGPEKVDRQRWILSFIGQASVVWR